MDNWQGIECYLFKCTETVPCELLSLELTNYGLIGTLPRELTSLTGLMFMCLSDNEISGSIPSTLFSAIPNLQILNVSYNLIDGTLPPTLANASNLQLLSLSSNLIEGSFPDFINPRNLEYLYLSYNQLTGLLPTSFGSQLLYFSAKDNLFEGSIPEILFEMPKLEFISLTDNYLEGIVPFSISNLQSPLYHVAVSNNYIIGSIPTSVAFLSNLRYLRFDSNGGMTGTLPSQLNTLTLLEVLLINCNQFTGTLGHLFPSSSVQYRLTNVDFSDNLFTGELPADLFLLPQLRTVALVKNCFHGSLPTSICGAGFKYANSVEGGKAAKGTGEDPASSSSAASYPAPGTLWSSSLEVMALDGLTSGANCKEFLWDPLKLSVSYFAKSIQGTIPCCVWGMPNLTTVHLSGNSLTGTISDRYFNANSSRLNSVSLSYNRMTGIIPRSLQNWPHFSVLDLAHNKFMGNCNSMTGLTFASSQAASNEGNGTYLSINNNRLSGIIPNSFHDAYGVNVLAGNLFACSAEFPTPRHDPDSFNYVCGSDQFNGALYVAIACLVFGVLACVAAAAVGVLSFMRLLAVRRQYDVDIKSPKVNDDQSSIASSLMMSLTTVKTAMWHNIQLVRAKLTEMDALTFSRIVDNSSADQFDDDIDHCSTLKLKRYLRFLTFFRNISIASAAVAVFVCLPIYLLFYTAVRPGLYSSHENRYGWITCVGFLTGPIPASVLLSVWGVLVTWLCARVLWVYGDINIQVMTNKLSMSWTRNSETSRDRDSFLTSDRFSEYSQVPVGSGAGAGGVSSPIAAADGSFMPSPSRNSFMTLNGDVSFENTDDCDPSNRDTIITNKSYNARPSNFKKYLHSIGGTLFFFTVNAVVSSVTNGLYITAMASEMSANYKTLVQIFMAGFKLFWNIIGVRFMVSCLPAGKHRVQLNVAMLIFNSLVAPCLATAATDSRCFEELFVKPDTVLSSYSFEYCSEAYQTMDYSTGLITTLCSHFTSPVVTLHFSPPFIYNYSCGSAILLSYIPVYMYTYAFIAVIIPLFFGILSSVHTTGLPVSVMKLIDGVLRPQDSVAKFSSVLMRPASVTALLVHHFVVLMTFGMACPPLAVVIMLAIVSNTVLWQYLIIRYIYYHEFKSLVAPTISIRSYARLQSSLRGNSHEEVVSTCESEVSVPLMGRALCRDLPEEPTDSEPSTAVIAPVAGSATTETLCEDNILDAPAPCDSSCSAGEVLCTDDDFLSKRCESFADTNDCRDDFASFKSDYQQDQDDRHQSAVYCRTRAVDDACEMSYKGLRDCLHVVLSSTMIFYMFILFDIAADKAGCMAALWVPIVASTVLVLLLLGKKLLKYWSRNSPSYQ